ncbi:MAG: hypothetical protein ACRD6W_14320, partial [Nitrososphaerales archaeon]
MFQASIALRVDLSAFVAQNVAQASGGRAGDRKSPGALTIPSWMIATRSRHVADQKLGATVMSY